MEENESVTVFWIFLLVHQPALESQTIFRFGCNLNERNISLGWGAVPLWIVADIFNRQVRVVKHGFLPNINHHQEKYR